MASTLSSWYPDSFQKDKYRYEMEQARQLHRMYSGALDVKSKPKKEIVSKPKVEKKLLLLEE